jgi:hypothetical protein
MITNKNLYEFFENIIGIKDDDKIYSILLDVVKERAYLYNLMEGKNIAINRKELILKMKENELEEFERRFFDYIYSSGDKKSKILFANLYSYVCNKDVYTELLDYFVGNLYNLDYDTFVFSFESIDRMLNLIDKNKKRIDEEERKIFKNAIEELDKEDMNKKKKLENRNKLYDKLLEQFSYDNESQITKICYPLLKKDKYFQEYSKNKNFDSV